MNKVVIVAVVYHEPEYQETRKCIESCNVPVVWIERNPKGVGSLAAAINAGFEIAKNHYDPQYVWFVTNVTFSPSMLDELIFNIEVSSYVALHPSFDSDHSHLRPKNLIQGIFTCLTVPFVEFTAPIVSAHIFNEFPLDENLPYWGHDLDWGYRVRQAGHLIGVYHGEKLGHTYIRHKAKSNTYTRKRLSLRRASDQSTRDALFKKYGAAWKDLRWPKIETEIGQFYNQVIQTQF